MNKQYERLLLKRNRWDGPIAHLDAPDELLEAAVRKHLCAGKPTATAALLYKYADIVAVHGIEETTAEPENTVKKPSAPPVVHISVWQAAKTYWKSLSFGLKLAWVVYGTAFVLWVSFTAAMTLS